MVIKVESTVREEELAGPPQNRRMQENYIEERLAESLGRTLLQQGKLRMRQKRHGAAVVYSIEYEG